MTRPLATPSDGPNLWTHLMDDPSPFQLHTEGKCWSLWTLHDMLPPLSLYSWHCYYAHMNYPHKLAMVSQGCNPASADSHMTACYLWWASVSNHYNYMETNCIFFTLTQLAQTPPPVDFAFFLSIQFDFLTQSFDLLSCMCIDPTLLYIACTLCVSFVGTVIRTSWSVMQMHQNGVHRYVCVSILIRPAVLHPWQLSEDGINMAAAVTWGLEDWDTEVAC